jgi:serine phosphatase RsbU (regulator of sigma subunit)
MEEKILQQFHQSIAEHRDILQNWLSSDKADKDVHLGDASVKDVLNVISEFKDLLEKIEEDTYGKCEVCKGEVEVERLEQDCTTSICLDCYSEEQLRELERDLELAAKVQQQLLPCCTPCLDAVQIACRGQSARVVGGDYHDFFTLKNGCQGVVIGDVMGKGLPASMLMSNLQASIRILGPDYEELDQLATHLNRLFRYNLKVIKFISLFLGSIDLEGRKFTYCNAGHHSPLYWRAENNSHTWLKPTAPAIGLIPEAEFKSSDIYVNSKDVIVFYTDGLIEVRNMSNEEYGEERLSQILLEKNNRSADDILKDIWNDVENHSIQISDDITIMVVKFL